MEKTKLYFDMEFTGLHQKTTLMSLGITAANNYDFYAEMNDYDETQVDDWLRENIIKNFTEKKENRINMKQLKEQLNDYVKQFDEIEIWSDCLSYDWVLFNEIWGHAFSLPKEIYYIPFDICTSFKNLGIDPDINREEFCGMENHPDCKKHNALWDALVIKACYEKTERMFKERFKR